ncbi:hypothetical protein DAPPUDRAFT_317721 [Daphnia pulex]|uniref:Uncharacterized protein n=1 Tax=Daphnia pulex TaxID=6669 RepID=E9GGS5_DAPPU|nr:hypothetical protein DAPPUDRAFT_317721 [Daphnia pulex]|eukprot:EFX81308.1 hypothetical protein DAPPUDRAFT_317721 [Daphnia pulex]
MSSTEKVHDANEAQGLACRTRPAVSRDAKQIESTCNTQETALLGTDLGSTAEEVTHQGRLSHAREDAMSGAKLVHVFDRNADESVTWIMQRKRRPFTAKTTVRTCVSGVQALLRKHAGFEQDLAAVKEQVDAVINEARKLSGLFPFAREHIATRHGETLRAWHDLLENGAQRKDKLNCNKQKRCKLTLTTTAT